MIDEEDLAGRVASSRVEAGIASSSEAALDVAALGSVDRRVVRGAGVIVVGLAMLAFVASLAVGDVLFPHLSVNNDEAVYVLEAKVLESGHLTLSAAAHGDAFRPWMSGRLDGHLVLVEQPVLPALMAVSDLVFGTMRVALAGVTAAGVVAMFLVARELTGDDRLALVSAGAFVLSPLVVVQSGLFLSYLLAVTLAAVVVTFVHRGVRLGSRRSLVAAGAMHGVLFFTRPLESILLAAVLAVWLVSFSGGRRMVVGAVPLLALGAVPVLALCGAYNTATTGVPWRFPLWVIGGNDAFGFGNRTIADGGPVIHVGVSEAFLALRANLRAFPHWFLGGVVCVPLIGWGAVVLWRRRRVACSVLAAVALLYPVGYFFYYGNYLVMGGRNLFGPHYYLGLLIPACVWFAAGVVDLVSRRRVLLAVLVPLLIIGTVVEVGDKAARNVRARDDIDAEFRACQMVCVRAPHPVR